MATFDGLLNRAALNTFFIGFTGDKLSCYLDLNHCNPPSLTSVKTRELLGYRGMQSFHLDKLSFISKNLARFNTC